MEFLACVSRKECASTLKSQEEAEARARALVKAREEMEEKRLRGLSYDEERRRIEDGEAAEDEKKDRETIHLYQRTAPLKDMIKRAIRHDEAIMWGKP